MIDEGLEPLDSELDALLESERRADPSPDALLRVWSRVALPPGQGGPGEGSGGGPATGRLVPLASRAGSVAVFSFLVGGAAGAALTMSLRSPAPERIVYVERPATVVPTRVAEEPVRESTAPAAPVASALHVARSTPSAGVSSSPSSLSAERALIDRARADLSSGDAAEALVRLGEHARRFPRPQLAEEREALVIQSLVTLRRYDEARAKGVSFRAASPESLFLPAIEASLASIP